MNDILPNILALDVGAKQIGAAVFENQRLVFYGVKSIKKTTEKETLKQVHNVLENLITGYGIQIITLRRLSYPQQQRSFSKVVYEEVELFANKNSLNIFQFEPLFIRQTICKDKIATKQNTFEIITRIYPELFKAFAAKRVWQKVYHAYLFNAIAVGLVCVKEIKGSNLVKITRKKPENEGI